MGRLADGGRARARFARTTMSQRLEVLVVESRLAMRTSLYSVLAVEDGIGIAGAAPDMVSAVRLAGQVHADVAVVDDRVARLGSPWCGDAIGALATRVPVIVLGMGESPAYTPPYLEAGASGYWCKTDELDELVRLMRVAATVRPRAA